jgi:hypothetical protein
VPRTPHFPPMNHQEAPARQERARSPSTVEDEPVLTPYQTEPDAMGLFRVYSARPTLIPSRDAGLDAIADAPTFDTQDNSDQERSKIVPGLPSPDIQPEDIFSAFSSPTAGLLMCWQYSGTNAKSAAELNRFCINRYRKVPTFGRGTIRRFHNNASAMKRLAARDFEDLLQVIRATYQWDPDSLTDVLL